jgi:queuine tRNA-ribosyltransferase
MSAFGFELKASDGQARRGTITTGRGTIETPAFMPVGTAATVKAMTPESVAETGAQIILGNTYHLMLRPGAERIERLGGLHKFMNWSGPILTDSGGFQVMSLSQLRKISENGVIFQSHIDGSRQKLTPESSMDIQRMLGADITMAFDECTPYPATEQETSESMQLSMRWAQRSRDSFQNSNGFGLFGIVQGGVHEDIRKESASALLKIGFDGYAIGGLAVGEGQELMFQVLDFTTPVLPQDKPRYLMGVGKPDDLVGAVARGVDMFDCVLPTRSGRTSQAFTRRGTVNLRNARHKDDPRPLDEDCTCPACTGYGRAYLNHLVHAKEILGLQILTWHNLHYYQKLMQGMRQAIEAGTFQVFQDKFTTEQAQGDIEEI